MSGFRDFPALRAEIERDGWVTPNTYGKEFAPIGDHPAVYLFLLARDFSFSQGLVAYVGMSTRLKQRINGHPVRAEIEEQGLWVSTWFKPVRVPELRKVEATYIKMFDPPWNIQGRVRGRLQ